MLINHVLFPKYVQRSFEDKRQKGKHLSNLNLHLFCKFFCRVILSRSSFIPTSIFHKDPFFYHFQHGIFFLSTAFYSRHVSFFFANLQSPKIYIFFLKKTNKTLVFSIIHFLFKMNYHPTSRKKQNEKLFFFYFFKN